MKLHQRLIEDDHDFRDQFYEEQCVNELMLPSNILYSDEADFFFQPSEQVVLVIKPTLVETFQRTR